MSIPTKLQESNRHAGDPARAARSRTALRAAGLVIGGGAFFTARSEQLATLALRHAVPTVYANREFAANVLRANAQLGDGNRERDTDTNHADDPSKAVGEGDTHVVPEKNRPQAHGEMADDEQRGEGIMGNESNVPRIMQ